MVTKAAEAYRQAQVDYKASREALKTALKAAHNEGSRAEELMELTGFSRATVFNLLERHGKWANRHGSRYFD